MLSCELLLCDLVGLHLPLYHIFLGAVHFLFSKLGKWCRYIEVFKNHSWQRKLKKSIRLIVCFILIVVILATAFKMIVHRGSANETVDNKKEIIKTNLEMILYAFTNDDKQELLELFSERSRLDNDLDSQIDETFF